MERDHASTFLHQPLEGRATRCIGERVLVFTRLCAIEIQHDGRRPIERMRRRWPAIRERQHFESLGGRGLGDQIREHADAVWKIVLADPVTFRTADENDFIGRGRCR